MQTQTPTDVTHEHPCGHDCQCQETGNPLCDQCEIAEVVLRRHHLAGMRRGEALARLYLAMQITVGEPLPITPEQAATMGVKVTRRGGRGGR